MITVNTQHKTVRETTAPYEHVENGELKTADIRVRYFSATTKELKEQVAEVQAKIKTEENPVFWVSESLIKRLESLPDLADDDGKPFAMTLEFLEALDAKNLKAIADAIREDENPKS